MSPPSEIRAKFLHSNDLEAAMRGVILELDRERTVHLFYPRISFSFPKKVSYADMKWSKVRFFCLSYFHTYPVH